MIVSLKSLIKIRRIPIFFFSKSKGTPTKKTYAKSSMLSFVKENVQNSLKTQTFGLQQPYKPQEKQPKKNLKPDQKHKKRPQETQKYTKQSYTPQPKFPLEKGVIQEEKSSDLFIYDEPKEENPQLLRSNRENTTNFNYFSIDFLQFPWNFKTSYPKPAEKNLKSPIDIQLFLYENEVISLIKTFLLSMEDFDYESLSDIIEPSFFQKLEKNLLKMQKSDHRIEILNLKKKAIDIDIFNIETIFGVGLQENRLKNDGIDYFDIQSTLMNEVPCVNIIHKNMIASDAALIILQISCSVESDLKINIVNNKTEEIVRKNDEIGKSRHLMILETVIVNEKYESLAEKALAFQKKELDLLKEDSKRLKKLKFYLIDFDEYMAGNPIIPKGLLF